MVRKGRKVRKVWKGRMVRDEGRGRMIVMVTVTR